MSVEVVSESAGAALPRDLQQAPAQAMGFVTAKAAVKGDQLVVSRNRKCGQVGIGPPVAVGLRRFAGRRKERVQSQGFRREEDGILDPEVVEQSGSTGVREDLVAHDAGIGQMPEKCQLCHPAQNQILLLAGHPGARGGGCHMAFPKEREPNVNVQKSRHDAADLPPLRLPSTVQT